ncbi:MAG TPA: RNA polymerase sigma factor SigJ, partial [Caulobacteraceae bacterium]|nr:RNA polymerase sigma factor SigJ [Caulobacteraceae bacterium]
FLLHDVFDQDYGQVASALGRTEAACRQLTTRARGHLKEARPRFEVSQDEAARLAAAFMEAAWKNDPAALGALLAEDAVLISDGGGKRAAALRPLVGRDDILQFIKALSWRQAWPPQGRIRPARINGYPGVVLDSPDGVQTFAFEPGEGGVIAAIYIMRNPEKLKRVKP